MKEVVTKLPVKSRRDLPGYLRWLADQVQEGSIEACDVVAVFRNEKRVAEYNGTPDFDISTVEVYSRGTGLAESLDGVLGILERAKVSILEACDLDPG